MCSKQKSDVPNDVTSDLAAMRCMSDIVFAAVSSQVCRKEGEEKAGKQGHVFYKPLPLPFMRRPTAITAHSHSLNDKKAAPPQPCPDHSESHSHAVTRP